MGFRVPILSRLWDDILVKPAHTADEESAAYLAKTPIGQANREANGVLLGVAASLIIINYAAPVQHAGMLADVLDAFGCGTMASDWRAAIADPEAGGLYRLIWWASVSISAYVLVPLAVIGFWIPGDVRDHGVRLKGALSGWRLYLFLAAVMVPVAYVGASQAEFQIRYPFVHLEKDDPQFWPRLLCWWSLYFAQFFALEFFFRGFMVHGLRNRFGSGAVWIMMVPYVMIHFQKPAGECTAAIVAGVVLGFLSLKSRTIWLGVAAHCTAALSMDVFCLWHKGYFS